jgi:hypothetical protein
MHVRNVVRCLMVAGLVAAAAGGAQAAGKKLFWEPVLLYGSGAKSIYIGKTTTGADVNLSGGGGFGFGVGLGCQLSSRWEIVGNFLHQTSHLEPTVENADAAFSRNGLLATLRYTYYRKMRNGQESLALKIGAGMGQYYPNSLTVSVWPHPNVSYKNAAGPHFYTDITFLRYFTLGMRYAAVSYTASSYSFDGHPTAAQVANKPYKDYIDLNGSSCDFIFSAKIPF